MLLMKKGGAAEEAVPTTFGSVLLCSESVHNCLSASFFLFRGLKTCNNVVGVMLCEGLFSVWGSEVRGTADVQQEGHTNHNS